MPQAVRQLDPMARLEVGKQVKLAPVVGAMAAAVQSDDAVRIITAAERARHQVGRVDRTPTTDEAGLPGDLLPLGPGCRAKSGAP